MDPSQVEFWVDVHLVCVAQKVKFIVQCSNYINIKQNTPEIMNAPVTIKGLVTLLPLMFLHSS